VDLRSFVSETLKEIIDGVVEVQKYAVGVGASVNPSTLHKSDHGLVESLMPTGVGFPVQVVAFDVALTTSEEDKAKGGIGVFVGPVGIGVQGQEGSISSSLSRVQFSIPVRFPVQKKT